MKVKELQRREEDPPSPMREETSDGALLRVENLSIEFPTSQGVSRVVDNANFEIARGGTLGIVGESGSGKSMTSLAIMGLLPNGGRASGKVRFDGQDLLELSDNRMRHVRGNRIAMIFQDPLSSLNPYYTVGMQIVEAIRSHNPRMSRKHARRAAIDAMKQVQIRDAAKRVDDYPHQFSGGMRQRIMIAMALSMEPDLLIADEPTTALDVTVQAQVLALLSKIREDTGAGLILITHDLAVVSEVTENLLVMRHGVSIEQGRTKDIFRDPENEYTYRLLEAVPRIGDSVGTMSTLLDHRSERSVQETTKVEDTP